MQRLLDAIFTALVLLLFIPTVLVLVSWNAIPGDALYPLKTGLEDITLLVLSGTPLVPKASIQFTQRRFTEAYSLLGKKGSTVGYSLLVAEAQQTQNYIATKKDKADSAAFIQNIDQYQSQIEQTKKDVVAKAQSSGSVVTLPTPIPVTPAPQAAAASPQGQQIIVTKQETVVIQQETPQQVLQNLNNTQAQLEQIKQEVQQSSQEGDQQSQGKGQENQGQNQQNQNQGGQDQQNQSQNKQDQGQGQGQNQGQNQ